MLNIVSVTGQGVEVCAKSITIGTWDLCHYCTYLRHWFHYFYWFIVSICITHCVTLPACVTNIASRFPPTSLIASVRHLFVSMILLMSHGLEQCSHDVAAWRHRLCGGHSMNTGSWKQPQFRNRFLCLSSHECCIMAWWDFWDFKFIHGLQWLIRPWRFTQTNCMNGFFFLQKHINWNYMFYFKSNTTVTLGYTKRHGSSTSVSQTRV